MNWSYSTHQVMRRCQRQLVFQYVIASAQASDPLRREVFLLKQLQSQAAWRGSVIHRVLATDFLDALRARSVPDTGTLARSARDLAAQQFAFSAERRYREGGMSKHRAGALYCALYEHDHGIPLSEDALEAAFETIDVAFARLAAAGDFVDYLRRGSRHFSELALTFPFAGGTVKATVDLLVEFAGPRVAVVDWKIGSSVTSDYSKQLLLYALAVERCGRWPGVRALDVELWEANLLQGDIRRRAIDQTAVSEVEDYAYRGMRELEALVGGVGADVDVTEFDVAARPVVCSFCNFASVCLDAAVAVTQPTQAESVQETLW